MVARVFGSFRRGLLALTLAGLAVRLAWVALEPATSPQADETMWVTWGASVLPSPEVAFSPLELRFVFHPPLYLYFVGVPFALFGTLEAVKYAQCFAGALLVPALGLLGRRAFGDRAALVAAAIAAFYPELVWFASHFWAETVFTVLLWWAMERLLAADARESTGAALVSGLLWGLAILTRETVLYFLPIAALWLAWRRAGGVRRAAWLLGTVALVVLPWTLRNWLVFEAFVPVSTAGALNLWQGNTRLSRQEVYEEYWAVPGKIDKYWHAQRRAVEAIVERQPLWILEKLRDEMPAFWAAHGQPIVHLERGAYGTVARSRALAAVAVVLLPYLAVLVLFVAGVARLPPGRAPALVLAFLAFYVLLHVVAHGYPRYRLPAMPAVFLVAAHGWTAWPVRRGRHEAVVPPRHRWAAAMVALALALSVGPSLVTWATKPWPPPWFAGQGIEGPGDAPSAGEAPRSEGR
jgi:4-amino-4-deoxy-L-arabinose transferase-like glycosyltransferase